MKNILEAFLILTISACTIEYTTEYSAFIKNETSHSIVFLPLKMVLCFPLIT